MRQRGLNSQRMLYLHPNGPEPWARRQDPLTSAFHTGPRLVPPRVRAGRMACVHFFFFGVVTDFVSAGVRALAASPLSTPKTERMWLTHHLWTDLASSRLLTPPAVSFDQAATRSSAGRSPMKSRRLAPWLSSRTFRFFVT